MRRALPWRLLALAVLTVGLSTQPVFLMGAAFHRVGSELGFSTTGLGVLTALFFLTASAFSPGFGRVVQRIGWRRAIRINAVGSSAMLVVTGALARSVPVLAGLLMVSAAIYGLSNPAANQALAEFVDPRHRALVFGLKHAGIPTSTLLAGLAVPTVMLTVGWRWAYIGASGLGLAVWFLVPRHRHGETRPATAEDERRTVVPMNIRRLLGLGMGSALATWAAISLSTFLVAAAVDAGMREGDAGILLFVGSAASIMGRIAAGRVTDRIGARGFGGITILAATGAAVFLLLPYSSGAVFAALVVAAFATGWGWPGLMTYAVVNANRETVAASSAITQAGVFVGAGVGPLVLGWIADRWSFDVVWQVVAVALIGAAVVVGMVGRSVVAAR